MNSVLAQKYKTMILPVFGPNSKPGGIRPAHLPGQRRFVTTFIWTLSTTVKKNTTTVPVLPLVTRATANHQSNDMLTTRITISTQETPGSSNEPQEVLIAVVGLYICTAMLSMTGNHFLPTTCNNQKLLKDSLVTRVLWL